MDTRSGLFGGYEARTEVEPPPHVALVSSLLMEAIGGENPSPERSKALLAGLDSEDVCDWYDHNADKFDAFDDLKAAAKEQRYKLLSDRTDLQHLRLVCRHKNCRAHGWRSVSFMSEFVSPDVVRAFTGSS